MSELDIRQDVPLAPHTTLELGGPARWFVEVEHPEELIAALDWARAQGVAPFVLGGGSNLIVPDEGFEGLVIRMCGSEMTIREEGRLEVAAGVPWERVVAEAVSRNWAGVECLTGIPGSTGATPIQNVGAYGQEVSEVIESVTVVDRETLLRARLSSEDCAFGYRDSLFKRQPDRYIVTAVQLLFGQGGEATRRYRELEQAVARGASLAEVQRAVFELRRRKSMVIDPDDPNRRSVGSFFVNPIVSSAQADRLVAQALDQGLAARSEQIPRYPMPAGKVKLAAGWLVERAGFRKGLDRGQVGVSSRHALALVHHGGGTTAELLALADEIARGVEARFGVRLEREPRILA